MTGFVTFVFVATIFSVAAPLLDAATPEDEIACATAAAQLESGDLDAAQTTYEAIPLAVECRAVGLLKVEQARRMSMAEAEAGRKLEEARLPTVAKDRYIAALKLNRNNREALDGLVRIGDPLKELRCESAAAKLDSGDLVAATDAYELMATTADCRAPGLLKVLQARQRAEAESTSGRKLEDAHLVADAKARYLEALKADRNNAAALEGLKRIANPSFGMAAEDQLATTLRANAGLVASVFALLVGIVAARWLLRSGHHRRTILVDKVDNATSNEKLNTGGLAALMRDRLEDERLYPPPPIPSLPFQESLVAVTSIVPEKGTLIAQFIQAIGPLSARKPDHTVKVTLGSFPDPTQLTVEVINSEGLTTLIQSLTAAVSGDAIKRAMNIVLAHIQGEVNVPLWYRWTDQTGESLLLSERAASAAKVEDAINLLKETVALEPVHLLVRLRLANEQERAGAYLDAMATYLAAVDQWPGHVRPRYRLAAVYSFVADWAKQWIDAKKERPDFFEDLNKALFIVEEISDPRGGPLSTDPTRWFLARANSQYERQTKLLSTLPVIRPPSATIKEEFSEASGSVTPGIAQAREVVRSAAICTELQIALADPETAHKARVATYRTLIRELDRIPGRSRNWQVLYNAACFRSRGLHLFPGAEKTHEANAAIKLLGETIHDPKATSALPSLVEGIRRVDPDLTQLRETDEFKSWAKYFIDRKPPPPKARFEPGTIALFAGGRFVDWDD